MLVCRISKEIDYGVDTFICYKRQKNFCFEERSFILREEKYVFSSYHNYQKKFLPDSPYHCNILVFIRVPFLS